MKRRKLRPDDSLLEQYRSVRQINSLTASECRQVVQLVRADDRGGGTAKRPSVNHPKAFPCLRELSLQQVDTGKPVKAWSMSLPALVQAKIDACPLYRLLMHRALTKNNCHLNLIFYQDEVSGGNILSPNQSRKSNLTYIMWQEFEILFLEDLWLTMGVTRSREIACMEGGMAALTKAMLMQIRSETQNGFAIDLKPLEEPVLCFIDSVILLMDHEAVRACTGTKGACGLKCCIKCLNVLSLNKASAVKDHFDITSADFAKFWPATDGSVKAAADRLRDEEKKVESKNWRSFWVGTLQCFWLVPWLSPAWRSGCPWREYILIRCMRTLATESLDVSWDIGGNSCNKRQMSLCHNWQSMPLRGNVVQILLLQSK